MNKQIEQSTSSKRHKKRYEHLERFSVNAVDHAIRTSEQLAQLSALTSTIARDEQLSSEQKVLFQGLETLARHYASEARMDMEHMSIAQIRHTSSWKAFKKRKPQV
jgi:hypothetical protein